jgi:hypothetical protein
MSPSDFYAAIDENIHHSGQHLQAVFPGVDSPGFIYTIGNALQGLPESLLIGNFVPHTTGPILNLLSARMRAARAPLEGDVDFGARFLARVRRASVAARQHYTLQASRYLGHEEYDVLQLLLCDPHGVYPGENGCEPDFDVPLA